MPVIVLSTVTLLVDSYSACSSQLYIEENIMLEFWSVSKTILYRRAAYPRNDGSTVYRSESLIQQVDVESGATVRIPKTKGKKPLNFSSSSTGEQTGYNFRKEL